MNDQNLAFHIVTIDLDNNRGVALLAESRKRGSSRREAAKLLIHSFIEF